MPALPILAGFAALGSMYVLGERMFSSIRMGIVTAALFASTPLLWRQFESAPASLYPLPFVTGWLVAAVQFQRTRRLVWLALAGALMGAGMFSSNAAAIMMPVYLLLSAGLLWSMRDVSIRAFATLVGAFAVMAGPFVWGLVRHPDDFRATVNAYRLYDANRFNVLQGSREMVSWVGLTARSEVYYDYFNPAFLFLTGGVLLWPLALLSPAGVCQILTREPTLLARLSLAGFLAAPFAAALTAEPPTARRIVFIIPFAAVVSVFGLRWLISRWRITAPDQVA